MLYKNLILTHHNTSFFIDKPEMATERTPSVRKIFVFVVSIFLIQSGYLVSSLTLFSDIINDNIKCK